MPARRVRYLHSVPGGGTAEYASQVLHEFNNPPVGDPVVDVIGIPPEIDDSLAAHDAEMLGDVGMGGLHPVPDLSHCHLTFFQQAEDFEPDGMADRFQQIGQLCNFFVFHLDVQG
jgi:hypothetical protein